MACASAGGRQPVTDGGAAAVPEDQARQALAAIADLVAVGDEHGRLTYANPALRAYGIGPGAPLPAGLPLAAVARTGAPRLDVDVDLRRAGGEVRRTRWHVTPLRDEAGGPPGAVGVGRDVTDAPAPVPSREDWLAMAAHDLRTPVTGLLGSLQLARRLLAAWPAPIDGRDAPARARLERHLVLAEAGARDLIGHMDLLLDAAAMAAGGLALRPTPGGVDLGTMVRQAAEQAGTLATRHAIAVACPPRPLIVPGDREQLRRVLDNLLTNAVKYAPEGGTITVRLAVAAAWPDAVATAPHVPPDPTGKPPWALLRVEDAGLGIPDAAVPHVFERYWRAAGPAEQVRGQGLGLYLCRAIVEAHGGRIWVERTATVMGDGAGGAWHGTVMAVALPLVDSPMDSNSGGRGLVDDSDEERRS
jgi:signal transduction histidine kinase